MHVMILMIAGRFPLLIVLARIGGAFQCGKVKGNLERNTTSPHPHHLLLTQPPTIDSPLSIYLEELLDPHTDCALFPLPPPTQDKTRQTQQTTCRPLQSMPYESIPCHLVPPFWPLTIQLLIAWQDPPEEKCQEGHPVLLDGLRRLRYW
jgi:hypothetical protein